MIHVGINLHSRNMTLVGINDNEMLLDEQKLSNTPANLYQFFSQFSARQFVSYCRLVTGAKDSGGKHRHRSKNKDGNRYLRIAFNQAAIIACRDYPVIKEFYKKVTRRSGKHVARTVVGKELAKIVWHMLSKDEEYKGFSQRDPFGKKQDDTNYHPKLLATTHKPECITVPTAVGTHRLIGKWVVGSASDQGWFRGIGAVPPVWRE